MIDAHIHLLDPRFNADRDDLIRQAETSGVSGFLCVSSRCTDWEDILSFSKKHNNIHPFIGTHPWYSSQHNPDLLKRLLLKHPFAGIGEIGLDAFKGGLEQENVFKSQLILAAELNRPCVIHCVKSFDKTAAVLKSLNKYPPSLLFHGFSGSIEQARFLIHFNAFFSFSGSILFPNKNKLRTVLTSLPTSRLLIETDAPDMLPPEQFRCNQTEKRNLPQNLRLIIREIARLKNTDEKSFIERLDKNIDYFLSGEASSERG